MASADKYPIKEAHIDELVEAGLGFENPRPDKEVDAASIKSLADDIARSGLRDFPIVWEFDEKGNPLKDEQGNELKIVISGKRRLGAFRLLIEDKRANGLAKAIPYRSFSGDLKQAKLAAILANLHRKDLSDYSQAKSVLDLAQSGMPQKDIAAELSMSAAWVSRMLRTFKTAVPEVQEAWKSGKLTRETVQLISDLDPEEQPKALDKHLAARSAEGSKQEVSKARAATLKKAKRRKATKREVVRTGTELRGYLNDLEGVKKDKSYLHGVADTLRLVLSEFEDTDMATPFKQHMKALAAERLAAEKAAQAAEADDDND